MKQYRVVSSDFFLSSDHGEINAILSPEDVAAIKSIVGIDQLNLVQNFLDSRKVAENTPPAPILREQKYND